MNQIQIDALSELTINLLNVLSKAKSTLYISTKFTIQLLLLNIIQRILVNRVYIKYQYQTLRLELRPEVTTVESFRNLILLFQGTEEWVQINSTAPWSRLVQQLLKPKRLIKLIQNHYQYDLSQNLYLLNYEILDAHPQNEIEETLNRIVCALISYHYQVTIPDPPQVSQVSRTTQENSESSLIIPEQTRGNHLTTSSSISTMIPLEFQNEQYAESQNTRRAKLILDKLTHQINNSVVGHYNKLFQY